MVRLLHLPFRDGDSLHAALTARMRDLPAALLRSITWDQGSEMARHTTIARSLGAPVYFCDSRSPWQRGSNEDANRLLRDYFPKNGPRHPLAGASAGPRERTQQPSQGQPPRPLSDRVVHGSTRVTESVGVATLTRTQGAVP